MASMQRERGRMLRIAVVSSLIAVGHAGDGFDLGGYSQGGSMNALCFTGVNPDFTPFNLKQYAYPYQIDPSQQPTLRPGANQVNYFITDGKAVGGLNNWQYSYYSNYDNSLTNNAAGQGMVTYDSPNWPVQMAGQASGANRLAPAGQVSYGVSNKPPSPPLPGQSFPPAPNAPGTLIAPAPAKAFVSVSTGRQVRGTFQSHVNPVGIQKVVFPSKYLGIAVGAATPTTASTNYPNILITKDNGASWHQVTGVPAFTRTPAQPYYQNTPTVQFPLPPQGAPDLFGLYCASKSLCWTVGGNGALASAATGVRFDATYNAYSAFTPAAKVAAASVPVSGLFDWPLKFYTGVTVAGLTGPSPNTWDNPVAEESYAFAYGQAQILMTTNGGTVWRNVPVTPDQTTIYAQYTLGPSLGAQIYNGKWWPGTLLSIHSDQAGVNVFAVGVTPFQVFDDSGQGKGPFQFPKAFLPGAASTTAKFGYLLNGDTAAIPNYLDPGTASLVAASPFAGAGATGYSGAGVTHYVIDAPYGTILNSNNGGVTWNLHTPPTLAAFFEYALFDVYVLKATSVFAVGGNLNNPQGQAFTDETLAMATLTNPVPTGGQRQPSTYIGPGYGNGIILAYNGNSWYQMSYPGMTYGNAPAFTCITFNNGVGWVGGYVYKAGPLLNAYGQYEFIGAPLANPNDAVTATYPVNGTLTPYTVPGLSYTVLITLDQRTWTPAPAASFPPGFIEKGTDSAPQIGAARVQAQQNVYGIEWDNPLRGWMYGGGSSYKPGFILSTVDGGNTWRYETPPDVLANGLHVETCANVPISR